MRNNEPETVYVDCLCLWINWNASTVPRKQLFIIKSPLVNLRNNADIRFGDPFELIDSAKAHSRFNFNSMLARHILSTKFTIRSMLMGTTRKWTVEISNVQIEKYTTPKIHHQQNEIWQLYIRRSFGRYHKLYPVSKKYIYSRLLFNVQSHHI